VVLSLSVAACSGSRGSTNTGTGGNTNGANTTNATPTSTSTGGSSAAQKFGDLASPCGKGDAKGSTDQGVTDTSIRIGYGDDRGFTGGKGLEQDAGDAVRAMIKWCNDQGGILGRKIQGDYYDAAITQTNIVMQQACKSDFMLVGTAFAGDETAEGTRVNCKLVMVPTYAVGPHVANAPMYYAALPNPVDFQPASGFAQLLKLQPQLKDSFAFMNSDLPAVAATVTKLTPVVKQLGYKVLNCGVTISAQGEPSYVPFATKFKQCGAKLIYISLNPSPVVFNFLSAMNQVGVKATYIMQASGYADYFAQWNRAGLGNNVYVQMPFNLLENAATVPATQEYLNAVKAVNGKTGLLGMQATSSFLLWATAAKECASTLTRQCMVNKLAAVHDWTGGGLHGKSDPGGNKPTECGLLAKLDGAKWIQAYPQQAGQYDCNGSYVQAVPQSAWQGVTLNKDRIATKFLTSSAILPQS
jgi:ABC-type branched-subunit amino acid transport system substrate-binding protein